MARAREAVEEQQAKQLPLAPHILRVSPQAGSRAASPSPRAPPSRDAKDRTYLRDRPALVVAADQLHALRIPQLETREQADGLDREQAAVDVVA